MERYSADPVRASDAERDHAARVLRDQVAEGRMSHETFERRIDLILRAQNRAELNEIVSDLPARSRLVDKLTGAITTLSQMTARIEAAWREPRLPRFPLPPATVDRFVIGRAPGCDLVLSEDLSVSRLHAELSRRDDGWILLDLNSMNGTRVNGRRVIAPSRVRVGDHVSFGHSRFVVTIT
jgi:hypothetical protein